MDGISHDHLERLSIPERLSYLASTQGHKTAVLSKSDALTFHQLDETADRVAQALSALVDRTQQTPVAVLLESGAAVISSIYGILRAGQFYCYISPGEPLEHIAKLLTDLNNPIVLTDEYLLDRFQSALPAQSRLLLFSQIGDGPIQPARPPIPLDALVGIFYTSGSTGAPKGVMRAHRDIQYMIHVFGRQLGFQPTDRILAMRPFGSVSSGVDVFGGLMSGAGLVTYDFKSGGVGELVALLKSERITIFRPPVQLMRSFLDLLPENEFFPDIRMFFATGDVLYKKDVERIRRIIPREAIIIHQLASSEAGMLAVHRIAHNTPLEEETVSVGHPLPGQELVILAEDGSLVTDGSLGEIGVRGDFIFPGYWRHPEWIKDSLLPDPRDPGKTIYRTGDLGRFRADGQLIFAGRNDSRVKVKGYSVDLSAVDAALQTVRGVKNSVTVAQANPFGAKRLVSYVQPFPDYVLSPSDLRKSLLRKLPDYMTPYLFVPIDEFPLTYAGKVDRKALPLPDWKQSQSSANYLAPRDPIEETMAQLWQKVFGIEPIGMSDNFFDLGGDSLLASALFVEIELAFKKRFPLSILLKHSTVEALANIVRTQNASHLDHLVALRATGQNPPLFLAPGGGADTITFLDLADALGEDQPVYGLEDLHVGTSRSVYAAGIPQAAREFIRAIKTVQPSGPYYLGGHSFGGMVVFEIARQLRAAGETVGLLAILDTNPPMKRVRKARFANRVQTHKRNLAGRSLKETAQYLAQRVRRRLSRLGKSRWFQALVKIPWIENLLWYDNRRYVQLARSEYAPGLYEGDAVVYRASERPATVTWDMTAAWSDFIAGKVEYYDVPGLHNYIIKYPNVEHLARLLKEHLRQARERE